MNPDTARPYQNNTTNGTCTTTAAPHTKSLSPPSPNSCTAQNNPSYMNGNPNPQHHQHPPRPNLGQQTQPTPQSPTTRQTPRPHQTYHHLPSAYHGGLHPPCTTSSPAENQPKLLAHSWDSQTSWAQLSPASATVTNPEYTTPLLKILSVIRYICTQSVLKPTRKTYTPQTSN